MRRNPQIKGILILCLLAAAPAQAADFGSFRLDMSFRLLQTNNASGYQHRFENTSILRLKKLPIFVGEILSYDFSKNDGVPDRMNAKTTLGVDVAKAFGLTLSLVGQRHDFTGVRQGTTYTDYHDYRIGGELRF